jgi:adenosylhomocysteine nucleosidase
MPSQDIDKPIGVVVAVQEELRAILRRMSPAVVDSAGDFPFYSGRMGGKKVKVVKSGMGAERAEIATSLLLETCLPRALIIAGFCGGLYARPGDLIIPNALMIDHGNGKQDEIYPDPEMVNRFRGASGPAAKGLPLRLLTSNAILSTRADKECAARDVRNFVAVDMESFGAGIAASRASTPWLVVRAVTDGPMDELPLDFSQFVDDKGEVMRGKVARAVLFRPWKIPAMIRLGARSSLAARNLAAFVERYVAEL